MTKIEHDTHVLSGDRLRVIAEFTSASLRDGSQTVHHETHLPYGYVRVSMTGEVAPRGVRYGTNCSSFGQVVDMDTPSALRRVWSRWHLNDMKAGCAHLGGIRQIGEACAFSGYEYGTAWLVDPLTFDGALDILRAMEAPSNYTVLAHDGIAVGVFNSTKEALAHLQRTVSYSWDHALHHEGWQIGNVIGSPTLVMVTA